MMWPSAGVGALSCTLPTPSGGVAGPVTKVQASGVSVWSFAHAQPFIWDGWTVTVAAEPAATGPSAVASSEALRTNAARLPLIGHSLRVGASVPDPPRRQRRPKRDSFRRPR